VPQVPSSFTVRFGVFEANLRSAELRKDGRKVKLQDQPFQLLAVLLERPGEIVTREELRIRLWPADTFVDFDHGLNAAIKRLRDALGDSAENPRFVETLARRGYRFIAPAGPASPLDPAAAVPPGTAAAPARNGARPEGLAASTGTVGSWRIALAAVALLFVGTRAGWVAAHHFNPKVQLAEKRLTDNPPGDPIVHAVISPDAKYLAFADRSGLFLRVVATGETHSIASPDGARPRPRSWFPDGSHLLVATSEPSSLWNISVLGGSPRKLIDNADARSVSPDGSQIAFVRGDWSGQEIWLMSANGEGPRKILGEAGEVFGSVAWSPSGDKLAFVQYVYKFGFHESEASLRIYDLRGNKEHSVLSDARLGDSLAWAADGRLIYSLAELLPNPSVKSQEGDSNFWALQIDAVTGRQVSEAKRLTSGWDKKMGLSLSADGKHLAFLRWRGEAHVYVSGIEPGLRRLDAPQRLSLDEGKNFPYAWTPDGKSVLFISDRGGQARLFKQSIDQAAPDLLVSGDDPPLIARLSPDGSEVFYLQRAHAKDGGKMQLMRMPLSGGTPQMILQREIIDNFQCARLPSTTCIFGQASANELRFFSFDPNTGKETQLTQTTLGAKYNWSLSPDGSTLALAQAHQREIQLLSTHGGPSRTLALNGGAGIASIDWAADGQTLWASSSTFSGTQGLMNIDLRGRVRHMLQDADKDVGWAIPSPDGRRLAFWEASGSSNVWLLQGF
jgi:Tol biopolymer transport system component/DNA-binding winged helix-turn-helix (wHTH) protein